MHIQATSLLATALLALPALSAPTEAISMMAATPQWTLTSFTRVCNNPNTSCTYTYGINTHTSSTTPCKYTVHGTNAADEPYHGKKCGAFTISSGWSGQFGPGKGFSTLAVTDGKHIVYPSYTDGQLKVSGKKVSPDQSYKPVVLPGH